MIIYASNGRQKADIPVDDNSTQVMELQGDNVLNLSFTLYEYVALEVNDYSEYMGRRYWLMERPRPEQVSTVEWKYDIKLYGIESLVKRFLVLHDTDGADEAVFTLTAPAREHVALVVASVNRGMGSGDWKVGMVEATGNLVIDYRGTFCHDALRQIAAQAGPRVEWWVEGQTVNLCRCEQGEEVTLAYDTGLTSLSCSTAEGFYTRLYPIGSSRNIDPQKYGHFRLQLPGGVKHVDVGVERYGVWHRFETDAFAAIYPRYIGTVTSVRREERKDKEGRSFTAWFFSDSSLPFDPNAYEIGGRVKRVSFQEGAELAGLGSEEDGTYYFEANFDSRTREWELITLWPHDDDTQLPGGQLVPKPGDRYIPWNIRMPDEYYPLAEREFREAVDRYNTEHAVDAAVYKALTDYLYLEEHDITLRLGSRVRLESAQYFPDTGFRCSRVTKITRRINRPSRMELEMSDARPAGMMESLHEDIADARRLVYRMTDGLPDVIRTNDSTPPSDSNVLSALRALATFLRKDRPDTMPHLLKLLDGLETGTFAAGRTGGRIDKQGNGELGSLTLRDLLTAVRLIADGVRSKNYTPGDMGTGFGLTTGEGGSLLEVDYLLVRRVATFLELLIREMRHVGGTLVLSGASGKVVRVEDKPAAWRVHFKTREDGTTVAHGFTVGAQARCQTYNRTSGNTYYWRLVTAVGDDWVELSKSDYDKAAPTGTARTAPAVGDELVQLGHRTDARQTGAIVLDTVGEGAPSIRLLKDIRSYSITDANVRVLLSPSTVRVIADEVSFSSGKTVEQTIEDSSNAAVTAAKEYFKEQKTEIDNSIGAVSGKVDNLVIGGRNLLINTQFTKRDSYQTVRGTYRIELDSVERYQGSNSLKLTNTKAGKIYEDVLVSGEQPAAGEYITVSLYAKAATAGTILSVRVCDNGEVQQTAALTTAWQRISFTFHALKAPSRAIGIWYDRADTVWIALPKMEVGNKVTDWSPAPEDVASDAVAKANQALADAKQYANGIQQDLTNSLNTARTELKKHAADLDAALLSNAQAYADGQITESEKRMVKDNREKLQAEQTEATKRLNDAIAEALSTAKGYVKDVQVGGRNYFGQHKGVATAPAGALSPDNNGVVFRNRDRLNCRIEKLNLPGVGWYAVSMFIRATKACTIASINLCDAVSKDKTLENVSVTTSFRYITGVFHAERYINDDRWNGFLDFESSIDPSIEVTVRDLMITPGNQPMSWVPAPEDLYADIAAKAQAAQDAAKEYTEAQDLYYQGLQNAYADGQITESEARMIKDAEEKLKAAKQDAQNKADAALAAANTHTNTIKNTLDGAISAAKTAAQNVQTNLDNLTIGGRNLLRYSGLEKTPLNNIVYGRKPENVPVGVEEGYQGAKAVKLVFTTPGKPSVSEVMWHTWEERTDHNRVEPVVLRFWAKADKDNTRMWTVLGYHGGKIARPTISSEWKEYTVNFMPDGPWALWCIGLDAPGTVWISRPKLEYGTKPTDWTPAPEDVDNSIDGVRNTANQASADAGDAKRKAGEAATSASKAESSAKNAEDSANAAKGKATEAVGSAKTASDKATNAANSASAAAESAQTAATNAAKAKADADAAKTRLDNWAADNVISPMEKQGLRDETARIDADKSQVAAGYAKYGLGSYQSFTDAYNAYRAVLVTLSAKQPETISIPADFATKQRNYYTQRSTALTRIADAAKEYVDGLQIGGRNLAVGSARHNFANGGSTPRPVVSFIEDNTVPSGVIIQIKCEKDCKPGFYSYPNPVRLTVGETYTWSFYAKCSVKKNGTIGCEQGGQRDINLTTEWQRFTHTFTVRATTWWAFTWYLNWNAGEVLYIHSFKLEKGSKPTDWSLAPEDITSEIAAKTEAARQAAQAEAIGLNKWIAQAYYTGENKAATPPKLEDIAGKTPTRTLELKDAQFNLSGNGSVFNMDNYTGIRTTYVYLDADYNLTTGIQHDDAGSLYVNGALVASGGLINTSWKSVTLPLKKGWNRIDGLWNEGGGGDFFKFQAPLENDAHIIQLACRPNVSIDPMRAVTMQSVEEQKAGFNTFNNQFTAWSKQTEKTLAEYNTGLTKLTERVTEAELELTHEKIWLGISEKVSSTVDDRKQTIVNELKSKTGIDIQQGVITLDAQKVKIQNGSQTMAMFEGEKLKAELIDVDKIFSKDITVRNNATITNLRAKNAVIEGTLNGAILNGVKGTFTQLETSTKSFSVTERDMKVLGVNINQQGTQDGKDLYFFGQDIMARSMLGFGSLAAVDVPVSNGGESNVDHFVYMRWYDAVGYPGPTSRVHYPGQNVTHANRVNLYGNGRYTVNICGAKDGQVVVVMNRSAQEKYVVMTRNRDHWTHTLKAYTFGIYIAPGNTNRYGIHYVNDLFALAAP